MSVGAEQLFDALGARKYVSAAERLRFLDAAESAPPTQRAFCLLVAYSGCRLSEALAITPARLDAGIGSVVFRTLKRRKTVYRSVPIPTVLLDELLKLSSGRVADERLWDCCRQTGWRWIKETMERASISGVQATTKGLRHGYGIANAQENVPPGLTQRWMGHARLETTVLYQHATGAEERAFAERLWRRTQRGRD
ncbi:tyrosine-type recombinase/integrase [Caulobacter sp. DWP3-1-3b2]|uniref:tyrosine-type recombinase/integrase n=1 Tax=Caulobacter sp. DWP3-1-3b2 TaxID=2804643 RepID=UPI003CF3987C